MLPVELGDGVRQALLLVFADLIRRDDRNVRLAVSGGGSVRKDPDGRVLQRGQDTLDDPVVPASRHMSITPPKTVPQRKP